MINRTLKYVLFILAGIFMTFVTLVIVSVLAQHARESHNRRSFPAPGEMVVIDDIEMHLLEKGEGVPMVFFMNASGSLHYEWGMAPDMIANSYPVLLYDRAGMGWSDPSVKGYTSQNSINDLHLVINEKALGKKVILVGHAYGGLLALKFALSHPKRVKGLVLIEPFPVEKNFVNRLVQTRPFKTDSLSEFQLIFPKLLSETGLQRFLLKSDYEKILNSYPDSVQTIAYAKLVDRKHIKSTIEECLHSTKLVGDVQNDSASVNLPITLITSAKSLSSSVINYKYRDVFYNQLSMLTGAEIRHIKVDSIKQSIPIEKPEIISDAVLTMINGGY